MGQKVNPKSYRMIIDKNWQSRWYARADFAKNLVEDYKIRKIITDKLPNSGIASLIISRNRGDVWVDIHTSKPGIIIGRSGQGTADLIELLVRKLQHKIKVNIIEVKNPETVAALVAENVANQITRRIAYKRAMKQAIEQAMEKKVKGIRIQTSGRLGGAEIARRETNSAGLVPLQTLRAKIDYAYFPAWTKFGIVGIKVWINHGERK